MDKYEYRVCLDDIRSFIGQRQFGEAAAIADTIDWRNVRSVNTLCLISDLYKANGRYGDSCDVMALAYGRDPGNPAIIYAMCELELKRNDYIRALQFYSEFTRIAPQDPARFKLQYQLYKAQNVSVGERIHVLEEYNRRERSPRWIFELAQLYAEGRNFVRCAELCDGLIAEGGSYELRAMELKRKYTPLTAQQMIRYQQLINPESERIAELRRANAAGVGQNTAASDSSSWTVPYPDIPGGGQGNTEEEYPAENNGAETQETVEGEEYSAARTAVRMPEDTSGVEDIHVRTADESLVNTVNLQAAVAEGLKEVLGSEPDEEEASRIREQNAEAVRDEFRRGFDVPVATRYGEDNFSEEDYDRAREYVRERRGAAQRPDEGYGADAAYSGGGAEEIYPVEPVPQDPGASRFTPEYERFITQEANGQITMRTAPDGNWQNSADVPASGGFAGLNASWEATMAAMGSKVAEENRRRLVERTGPILTQFEEETRNDPFEAIERENAEAARQARVRNAMPGGGELSDGMTENEKKRIEQVRGGVRSAVVWDADIGEAATRTWGGEEVEEALRQPDGNMELGYVSIDQEPGREITQSAVDAPELETGDMPALPEEEEQPYNAPQPEEPVYAPQPEPSQEPGSDRYGSREASDSDGREGIRYAEQAPYRRYNPRYSFDAEDYSDEDYLGDKTVDLPYLIEMPAEKEKTPRPQMAAYNDDFIPEGTAADESAVRETEPEDTPAVVSEDTAISGMKLTATQEIEMLLQKEYEEQQRGRTEDPVSVRESAIPEEPDFSGRAADIVSPEDLLAQAEETGVPAASEEPAGAETGADEYVSAREEVRGETPAEPAEPEPRTAVEVPEEAETSPENAGEAARIPESAAGTAAVSAPAEEPEPEKDTATEALLSENRPSRRAREAEKSGAPITETPPDSNSVIDNGQEVPEDHSGDGAAFRGQRRERRSRDGRKDDAANRRSFDAERIHKMSQERRHLFASWLQEKHTRSQLLDALDLIDTASASGNVILTAEDEEDCLAMAKALFKDLKQSDRGFSGKVAVMDGPSVNRKSPNAYIRKLIGGGLIITNASGLSDENAEKLHEALTAEDREIVVIIADGKEEMDGLIARHPVLAKSFNARVDIRNLSDEELVKIAERYARIKDCVIDNMAVLALHSRISSMRTDDHHVTVDEVKAIVDEAIAFAEKKSFAHLMDAVFKRRYDEDDRIILTEKDFTHYDEGEE